MNINSVFTLLIIFFLPFRIAEASVYNNQNIGVHVFHIFETQTAPPYAKDDAYRNGEYIFGITYNLINTNHFNFGLITTDKPFPTHNSVNTNFLVQSKIKIHNITIQYSHISNGFGVIHPINPGFDKITVHVNF